MISKFFISILRLSAFFLRMELREILNPRSNAHDA